jgi:hypothetical protein
VLVLQINGELIQSVRSTSLITFLEAEKSMRHHFCKLSILLLAPCLFSSQLIEPCYAKGPTATEKLPQLNSSWQSGVYNSSGLSIHYPAHWQVSEKPDKDTAVKISGALVDGSPAEMSFKLSDAKGVSKETLSKFFAEANLSKLPKYQLLSDRNVSFGEGWHIEGIDKQISFDQNGVPFRQRYVFFDGPLGVMIVTFTAPAASFANLQPISDRILMSVKKEQTRSVGGRSDNSFTSQTSPGQPESWTFDNILAPSSPLRFSYPKGWAIQTRQDKDHPLSIHGNDSVGKPGFIEIYSGDAPPIVTLESLATTMEEKHFAGLKDYRRIKQEPISCGSMNRIQGILHEMTFVDGGQAVKQMCLFFVQDGRLYLFTLVCPGWKETDVRTLFHKLAATINTP